MSYIKDLLPSNFRQDIFTIGGYSDGRTIVNPFVGSQVSVTWRKPWGGRPAGYQITGKLLATFAVRGRTLIGEIEITRPDGSTRVISAPWSKNYIEVEVDALNLHDKN